MKQKNELQTQLIQEIKTKIPAHIALVDEISEILGISDDSAYRRIRGEKQLSLDETVALSRHFGISLDKYSNSDSGEISFHYKMMKETSSLEEFLQNYLDSMKYFESFPDREIMYQAKDIPFFHLFYFPEIAAFKTFFWKKSIIRQADLQQNKFSLKETESSAIEIGKRLLKTYMRFPSSEIWSEESITSILKQIEFYYESGWFKEPEEAFVLLDKLSALVVHLMEEATAGTKFLVGEKPNPNNPHLLFYFNEILLSENLICVKAGETTTVFLAFNTLNFLSSSNPIFCEFNVRAFNQLTEKSVLVSKGSEKIRNKIFKAMQDKIVKMKARLEGI